MVKVSRILPHSRPCSFFVLNPAFFDLGSLHSLLWRNPRHVSSPSLAFDSVHQETLVLGRFTDYWNSSEQPRLLGTTENALGLSAYCKEKGIEYVVTDDKVSSSPPPYLASWKSYYWLWAVGGTKLWIPKAHCWCRVSFEIRNELFMVLIIF